MDIYPHARAPNSRLSFFIAWICACTGTCLCAYGASTAAVRNKESAKVLSSLGVNSDTINWLGTDRRVPNLRLHLYLQQVLDYLLSLVQRIEIASIFAPAWEGGHPDHDAAALL